MYRRENNITIRKIVPLSFPLNNLTPVEEVKVLRPLKRKVKVVKDDECCIIQ